MAAISHDARTRRNQYFVPGEGIAREVITSDICKYLDNDATVKPGNYQGRDGYFVYAYRNLTTEMIHDLQQDSAKWEQEKRNARRGGQGGGSQSNDRRGGNRGPEDYSQSRTAADRDRTQQQSSMDYRFSQTRHDSDHAMGYQRESPSPQYPPNTRGPPQPDSYSRDMGPSPYGNNPAYVAQGVPYPPTSQAQTTGYPVGPSYDSHYAGQDPRQVPRSAHDSYNQYGYDGAYPQDPQYTGGYPPQGGAQPGQPTNPRGYPVPPQPGHPQPSRTGQQQQQYPSGYDEPMADVPQSSRSTGSRSQYDQSYSNSGSSRGDGGRRDRDSHRSRR